MKTRLTLTIGILIIVLAASGALVWRQVYAHPPLGKLVTSALFHESRPVSYTADAVIRIHYCGKDTESLVKILHGRQAEAVVQRTADGREMFSKTSSCSNCTYMPATNTMLVNQTAPMLGQTDLAQLLLDNYQTRYFGRDRVAGRSAYVVQLVPRIEGRPSRKLWIDAATNVVLRSKDYSCTGDDRGGMEITSINYNAPVDPESSKQTSCDSAKKVETSRPASIAELSKLTGIQIAEPAYIPQGFKLEGTHLFIPQCNCCKPSAQLTYTDGLYLISVFERPEAAECAMGCCKSTDGKSSNCHVAGCDMAGAGSLVRGGKKIVVIADLPDAEIAKVAESVR